MICPVCKDEYVKRQQRQKCCGSNLCKSKYNYYLKTNRLWMLDKPKEVEPEMDTREIDRFIANHPSVWIEVWKEAA